MNKSNGKYPDLMVEGFHELDSHLLEPNAPKIAWGEKYKKMTHHDQVRYLKNIASAMNHAAYLIQNERNDMIDLCRKQEEQIKIQQEAVDQNNLMLTTEITKMNELKQKYNAEIARLNQVIRDGNID